MPKIKKIEDDDLMPLLSSVFCDHGYEGASLTLLSQASGLKKPSLYHRFPQGKEQMAAEVLAYNDEWIQQHILAPIEKAETKEEQVHILVQQLGVLYDDGQKPCLLNMLAPVKEVSNPFTENIKQTMIQFIALFSGIAMNSGLRKQEAEARGEKALIEIQGALVISKGLGDSKPFNRMLKRLPGILLNSYSND